MKFHLTLVSFLFAFISCSTSSDFHYKNSDETSGGFLEVYIDFNADNSITIKKGDAIVDSLTEGGAIYSSKTTTITGTWKEIQNFIQCDFNSNVTTLTDAFFNSKHVTKNLKQNGNKITFPINCDTIFIYGQPCLLTKATNR